MIVATMLSGNSEAIIGDALRSVVDWVSAVLLIDTGITDDSLNIARRVAANKLHVHKFPWQNDFAAARNFALESAAELRSSIAGSGNGADHQNTFALTIDTDERLEFPAYSNQTALEEILAQHTAVQSWFVPIRSGWYAKERLIRIPTHLRWFGRTHETLIGATMEQRRTLPGCFFTELTKPLAQYRHKLERDLAILEAEIRDHPTDARWWYYLGQTRQGLAGLPESENLMNKSDRQSEFLNPQPSTPNQQILLREASNAFRQCALLDGWAEEAAWSCYQGASCLHALKDYSSAVELCQLGMTRHPGFPELPWLAGLCCYELEQYSHAIKWEKIAIHLGHIEGVRAGRDRISFRHLPAWYEGPFDVLRYVYQKLNNRELVVDFFRKHRAALKVRHDQCS